MAICASGEKLLRGRVYPVANNNNNEHVYSSQKWHNDDDDDDAVSIYGSTIMTIAIARVHFVYQMNAAPGGRGNPRTKPTNLWVRT